jgi:hypothetical protein
MPQWQTLTFNPCVTYTLWHTTPTTDMGTVVGLPCRRTVSSTSNLTAHDGAEQTGMFTKAVLNSVLSAQTHQTIGWWQPLK